MDLYSPRTIRQLKDKYGFRFAKGLGQNFLTDPSVPEAMVRGAGISERDLVVEIGPGIGVLPCEAARAAGQVMTIEVDQRLLPILEETLQDYDNIEVINADVLQLDLKGLISQKLQEYQLEGVKIIGNLPYYITTPIIMKLLEDGVPADSITVMMQKEVADRICSQAGSRVYGAISVCVQYYCQTELLLDVPRHVFMPQPKVDSAILLLEMRQQKAAEVSNEELFFRCVRAGFGQRRKTLCNSLSGAGNFPKDLIREVLNAAGIEESRRAETWTIEEFARIANQLDERLSSL